MKPESAVMSPEPRKGRPESPNVQEAMRLVAQGMSQYKAYRQAQCSESGLYKALKRARANPAASAESDPQPV